MKLKATIFILLAFAFLTSCVSEEQKQLYGTWVGTVEKYDSISKKKIINKVYFKFQDTGYVLMWVDRNVDGIKYSGFPQRVAAEYTFTGSNSMKFSRADKQVTLDFEFDGPDKAKFTLSNGEVLNVTRTE